MELPGSSPQGNSKGRDCSEVAAVIMTWHDAPVLVERLEVLGAVALALRLRGRQCRVQGFHLVAVGHNDNI
jgi:hypothetical protein